MGTSLLADWFFMIIVFKLFVIISSARSIRTSFLACNLTSPMAIIAVNYFIVAIDTTSFSSIRLVCDLLIYEEN